MHKEVIVMLLLALLIPFAGPSFAGDNSKDAATKQELEKLNDMVPNHNSWAISLNVLQLDKFLDYKGTKLYPVVQVKVSLATRDDKSKNFDEMKLYEQFWFHKKTPLGVSRKMPFSVPTNSLGTIVIDETADAEHETLALCNAIVRIVLDAHLFHAAVSVIAPENLCTRLGENLSTLRFREVTNIDAKQEGVILHVFTETRKFDNNYLFEN